MGGVDRERPLGVGLTPPTLNHQEKPPDTQSTSGGVGGGRGQPRPLSRLVIGYPLKESSVGATYWKNQNSLSKKNNGPRTTDSVNWYSGSWIR